MRHHRSFWTVTSLAVVLWTDHAYADPIPPACAQLIRAYEVCAQEYIQAVALVDPKDLDATKKKLDPSILTDAVKRGEQKDGVEAQAERCADPKNKGSIMNQLGGLATAMGFMGFNAQDCVGAIDDIR